MSDLTVACVNVENYCGRGREYVRKLAAAVKRTLHVPYRFVCVTDDMPEVSEPGITDLAARPVSPGGAFRSAAWLQKVEFYQPGFLPPGRVLYLDLDTLLVGDMAPLAGYTGDFAGLRNFYDRGFGTGILAWSPEGGARMWEFFEWLRTSGKIGDFNSEQAAINGMLPDQPRLQDVVPDAGIVSYKVHCTGGLPTGARVVCFHGRPRPHEVNGWVAEAWRE